MINPPTSHTITVNAAEQDHLIDSVTVFQAGRAEIKRRVQLELKKGQNQVNIQHLPSCLAEDSLRVQGTGTAVIFDVVYHSPKPKPGNGGRRIDPHSSDEDGDEETEYSDTVDALKKQRTTIENQISLLDRYARSVDGQNSNMENLERFLEMYGSRRDALDKRMRELNLEVNQAEKALRVVQKKKPAHKTKEQRRTNVTVTVMSKEEGKVELMLTYVVSNASWAPIYEIRASITSSPDTPSTIALHYRASLTQTTGEDWPEVALTLSTATPYHGATMPTLSTWRIGLAPTIIRVPTPPSIRYHGPQVIRPPDIRLYAPHIIRVGSPARSRSRSHSPTRIINVDNRRWRCSGSRSRSSSSSRSRSRLRSRQRTRSPSPQTQIIHVGCSASSRRSETPPRTITQGEPAPMIVGQADSVDVGVLSATFNISGRSNIPSDQGNHKVLITSLDFNISPEWACIPRENENMFLRCKVVNSSEFTFLPGEASIFMGDNFVSKSQIQHVVPKDSFLLSLGADPALRVTYAPMVTHKRTTGQPGSTRPGLQRQPSQVITTYNQQIIIRNTRPTAVLAMHVLDHVPVSDDSTIKVTVASPQGLQENQNTGGSIAEKQHDGWVRPQTGVRARWADPEMGGEGAIEWVCAIGAGAEIVLKLGWEVSAPEGTTWRTL